MQKKQKNNKMRYIIIRGTTDSGKSTTMNEICKRLNPNSIKKLKENTFVDCDKDVKIFNDTFLITYKNKNILVVAGAPTEQNKKITTILEICVKLKIEISIALVSMRSVERKENYNTPNELKKFGTCLLDERIWLIEGDYKESKKWNERIENIVSLINKNI